jgi:hypothetical protein
MLELLIDTGDTMALSEVLIEAYLACGQELSSDAALRASVLRRIALSPATWSRAVLGDERLPQDEVARNAWETLGGTTSTIGLTEAFNWCLITDEGLPQDTVLGKLHDWKSRTMIGLTELIYVIFLRASFTSLLELDQLRDILKSPGPGFSDYETYTSQAEIALMGLGPRVKRQSERISDPILPDIATISEAAGLDTALLHILSILTAYSEHDLRRSATVLRSLSYILPSRARGPSVGEDMRHSLCQYARALARRLYKIGDAGRGCTVATSDFYSSRPATVVAAESLDWWAQSLDSDHVR